MEDMINDNVTITLKTRDWWGRIKYSATLNLFCADQFLFVAKYLDAVPTLNFSEMVLFHLIGKMYDGGLRGVALEREEEIADMYGNWIYDPETKMWFINNEKHIFANKDIINIDSNYLLEFLELANNNYRAAIVFLEKHQEG